mgnify:CR=1 FL=1
MNYKSDLINKILPIWLDNAIDYENGGIYTCLDREGNIYGTKFKSKAEFTGGLILILLGVKILLEHLGVINF